MVLFLFLFYIVTFCQDLDSGWMGVRPLHTDKRTVDKLFGDAIIDEYGDHHYSTENASITVSYTGEPCRNLPYGRGKYNVRKNTVLDYIVRPKGKLPISSLKFDKKKYERDTGGDITFIVGYNNSQGGVNVEVLLENGEEYVHTLRFHRTAADFEKFKCK